MAELPVSKSGELAGQHLMQRLLSAFQQRYDDIMDVIDDALDSDVMKERIWAVEQILKRCKLSDEKPALTAGARSKTSRHSAAHRRAQQEVQMLSPEALWRELDQLFKQVQQPTESTSPTAPQDIHSAFSTHTEVADHG